MMHEEASLPIPRESTLDTSQQATHTNNRDANQIKNRHVGTATKNLAELIRHSHNSVANIQRSNMPQRMLDLLTDATVLLV